MRRIWSAVSFAVGILLLPGLLVLCALAVIVVIFLVVKMAFGNRHIFPFHA